MKRYYENKYKFGLAFLLPLMACICSCSDSSFLDEIPDRSLVLPTTLDDYQAILDNERIMNGNNSFGVMPALGEAGSDDYTFREDRIGNLLDDPGNIYTWNRTIFGTGRSSGDWANPYSVVFYANSVLDGIEGLYLGDTDTQKYNGIKGSALFHRSHAFYHLAQVFAPQYTVSGAQSLLGIPLRLNSDINERTGRSSLEDTYHRILSDLKTSVRLLPETQPFNTRPSKQAAYALLARVYLTMGQYVDSHLYADSCLQIGGGLLDFNGIPGTPTLPFSGYNRVNPEILFLCRMAANQLTMVSISNAAIVDGIYDAYHEKDLRKSLFFRVQGWGNQFRGSYSGSQLPFAGLALDEVYLIRAECLARMGRLEEAVADLNYLLVNRWESGEFVPLSVGSREEVLRDILTERRKELVMRGLRWIDLRRLNWEGADITLSRELGGETFYLPPNDPRYTYPIPPDVLEFNPDMPQNIR